MYLVLTYMGEGGRSQTQSYSDSDSKYSKCYRVSVKCYCEVTNQGASPLRLILVLHGELLCQCCIVYIAVRGSSIQEFHEAIITHKKTEA